MFRVSAEIWATLVMGVVMGLAVGYLLWPYFATPRLMTAESGVIRNGVVSIVVCGKDSDFETQYEALDYAPRPSTGVWASDRRGDCTLWFHVQPGE